MASPDYNDLKLPPINKTSTQNKSYVERHLSGITGHQQTLQVVERQTEASGISRAKDPTLIGRN